MDTQAVLTMLQEAADEFINPRFESLARHEVMEKNPGDLVTVADREAEVAITARLLDAYPDALIVGEEAVAAALAFGEICGEGEDFGHRAAPRC